MPEETVPDTQQVIALAAALRAQAFTSRHRAALVLSGSPSWARQLAAQITASLPVLQGVWISDSAPPEVEAMSFDQATTLLGQEREILVYDAFAGFDPDAFGAVSGIVRAGGLLLLLTPPLAEWPAFKDQAAERIAVGETTYRDVSGRFLQRLVRCVAASQALAVVKEGSACPVVAEGVTPADASAGAEDLDPLFLSQDQAQAVAAVGHVLSGHRRRPAVLIADRGRGKTSALGIAAARQLQAGLTRIVVTAPRLAAVEPLFAHAEALLPGAQRHGSRLVYAQGVLEFLPPDELNLVLPPADLVLVDEAAAIPAPLLERYLAHYSRIVFATTIHGYEGSGRGFAVRFRKTLDVQAPGWQEVKLTTPIRWAGGDPLEAFVNRALLLDAAMAEDELVAAAEPGGCEIVRMSRDTLLQDEVTLSQLFGLLVSAHYRTTPTDLRNLLDGPNLSVYVMRFNGHVVGAALVAAEGGLSNDVAHAVQQGRRRLRGHLIPQSLTLHAQLAEAAALRGARVMRIAIHPALQGRGLGSALFAHIRREAQQASLDWVGVSFGATVELMQFWQRQGLQAVRLGFSRDHASACHSVMMLAGLSDAGQALVHRARVRFEKYFPLWLSDPLRELDSIHVCYLLRGMTSATDIAPEDLHQVEAFVRGACPFEDSAAALALLAQQGLVQTVQALSPLQAQVLVLKLLQRHSFEEAARKLALKGRKDVVLLLREAARVLLQQRI